MKKYILISALTAFMVSAILLLGAQYFGFTGQKTVKIQHVSDTPVSGALYTVDRQGDLIPLDFTQTSAKVIDAVVHITSTQLVSANSSNRQRNPMDDLFQDEFLERFFGPQFKFESPGPSEPRARTGSGSGVIISNDGYIVTNHHVIADANDIEVTMNDNRSFKATLIGMDPTTDLALIKIDEANLPTLEFMDSDIVKVGEWVLAVGNPFNLTSTVTAGIVSAKSRNINILRDQYAIESFIQTDAAINPGNSGGALVDLEGRLIGINTAIASPTGSYSGYGFAIPSNIAKKVIEDLLEFGTVQRGFIGAMIRSVDNKLARELNLSVIRGVYIDSLVEGGAAQKAGMKSGDVITHIQGLDVYTNSDMLGMIARHRPGDKIAFTVVRDGKEKLFTVTLNNGEGTTERLKAKEVVYNETLGAELAVLSKSKAEKLQLDGGLELKSLKAGKLKSETNIKEGFIVLKVNRIRVKTISDLDRILEDSEDGVLLEGIYPGDTKTRYFAFGL